MRSLSVALIVCFGLGYSIAYADECRIELINDTYPLSVIKFVIFDEDYKSLSSGWVRSDTKDQYLKASTTMYIKYRVFRSNQKPPRTEDWKTRCIHCGVPVILR